MALLAVECRARLSCFCNNALVWEGGSWGQRWYGHRVPWHDSFNQARLRGMRARSVVPEPLHAPAGLALAGIGYFTRRRMPRFSSKAKLWGSWPRPICGLIDEQFRQPNQNTFDGPGSLA
jgi:hypothetical protein